MRNKVKKFLMIILCCSLCGIFGACQNESEDIAKDELNNLYISFTVTHAVEGDNESFESDVYYYDIETKEVKKMATVPYTAQYPLATYDARENVVYYSGKEKGAAIRKDELFEYDIDT